MGDSTPPATPTAPDSNNLDLPDVTENRRRASLFRMCNTHTQTAIIELREALETLSAYRCQQGPAHTHLAIQKQQQRKNSHTHSHSHAPVKGGPTSLPLDSVRDTGNLDDVEIHLKQALEVLLHSGHPNANASPTLSALSSSFHRRLQAVSNELSEEVSEWLSSMYSPRRPAVLAHSDSGLLPHSLSRQTSDPGLAGLDDAFGEEVQSMLNLALEWEQFDVFKLDELTGGHALSTLAVHFFKYFGVVDDLQLSLTKLRNFWLHIEIGYKEVPYHNHIHAADVMQELAWFLNCPSVRPFFKPLEICAALVAAGIHDHEHPGLNNSFLINTSHELALLYNDRSVLENHHASSGLIALQTIPHNNFLSHLDKSKFQSFRQLVISMVLATDMSGHFQLQAEFSTTFGDFSGGPTTNLDSAKRELLLQQILHCADLANTGKPFNLAESWGDRVAVEFFTQGDQEKSLGLTVSAGNNRQTNKVEHSQMAFIQHIVKPMFEKMLHVMPETQKQVDFAGQNIAAWNERYKRSYGTSAATAATAASTASASQSSATGGESSGTDNKSSNTNSSDDASAPVVVVDTEASKQ